MVDCAATLCRDEIHVLDIGTKYSMEALDNCAPFDPSDADALQLIFSLPGGVVLVKDATLETDAGSPPSHWYLTYTVQPGDGLGSPPDEFHAAIGPLKVQFYVHFADGRQFHSTIQTTDITGRELRIHRNLA